jgi:hypothetical protein
VTKPAEVPGVAHDVQTNRTDAAFFERPLSVQVGKLDLHIFRDGTGEGYRAVRKWGPPNGNVLGASRCAATNLVDEGIHRRPLFVAHDV